MFEFVFNLPLAITGSAIIALGRPFRGDLGLGTEPYQLVFDQLMKP